MPRNERSHFSARPEGPRTPAEISHEQASRAIPKSASDVAPWDKPEFKEFLAGLSPTETPPPAKSRVRHRIVEPEDVMDESHDRPSIRAIRLQGHVSDLHQDLVRTHPDDAEDLYRDDIRELEIITHGLIADPENEHLISQLKEIEQRYRGR